MNPVEEKLLRGTVALLPRCRDLLGETHPFVGLLERLDGGEEPNDGHLEEAREQLRILAENSQTQVPIGHGEVSRAEELYKLVKDVPAGWFNVEEIDGSERWMVSGMAPLATPDLAWIHAETLEGDQLA